MWFAQLPNCIPSLTPRFYLYKGLWSKNYMRKRWCVHFCMVCAFLHLTFNIWLGSNEIARIFWGDKEQERKAHPCFAAMTSSDDNIMGNSAGVDACIAFRVGVGFIGRQTFNFLPASSNQNGPSVGASNTVPFEPNAFPGEKTKKKKKKEENGQMLEYQPEQKFCG